MTWPKDGDGCRWDSQPEHPGVTFVRLQGIGHVRVHQHRLVAGRVKTIGLKREGSRWYVVLSCDDVLADPLAETGAVAGIDLGEALAAARGDLARKKRRSRRRRKAVARVAALDAKVRRQRLDGVHKAALSLVRDYDAIVVEDLHVANMTRRAAPQPDREGGYLPNGAAAKSGLNRSGTSRTCARCGHCAKENRLTQAKFACTACGHQAHADVNAAINILRAGLALRDAAQAA